MFRTTEYLWPVCGGGCSRKHKWSLRFILIRKRAQLLRLGLISSFHSSREDVKKQGKNAASCSRARR